MGNFDKKQLLNKNTQLLFIFTSEITRWNASDGRCQAVNHTGFYGIPRLLKVFTQVKEKQRTIYKQLKRL
jgi:hypothetical protein